MIQRICISLLVAVTALLAACGGGDGGGNETPSFVGTYGGTVSITSNPCSLNGLQSSLALTQSVSQSDRNITLISGLLTFTGGVDADNGGFATTNKAVSNGIEVNSTMNYRTVTPGSSYAAQFTITAGTCTVTYSGSFAKK